MTRHFRRTRICLSSLRLAPHIVIMLFTTKSSSAARSDLTRWAEILELNTPKSIFDYIVALIELMTFYPEYRNVFYLRHYPAASFVSWLCPPRTTLEITRGDIGPGLFIQHGFATTVSAAKIGANCWINQRVTIGYSDRTNRPTIGNNVKILAGAAIIGNVKIGDNVTVGANTVVVRDVPSNMTVFGVPGRNLWDSTEAGRPQVGRVEANAQHNIHSILSPAAQSGEQDDPKSTEAESLIVK